MKKVFRIISNVLLIGVGVVLALMWLDELSAGEPLGVVALFSYNTAVGLGLMVLVVLSIVFGKIAKIRINLPLRIITAAMCGLFAIPFLYTIISFGLIGCVLIMIAHLVELKVVAWKPYKIVAMIASAIVGAYFAMFTLVLFLEDLIDIIKIISYVAAAAAVAQAVLGIVNVFKEDKAAPEVAAPAPAEEAPVAEEPKAE